MCPQQGISDDEPNTVYTILQNALASSLLLTTLTGSVERTHTQVHRVRRRGMRNNGIISVLFVYCGDPFGMGGGRQLNRSDDSVVKTQALFTGIL